MADGGEAGGQSLEMEVHQVATGTGTDEPQGAGLRRDMVIPERGKRVVPAEGEAGRFSILILSIPTFATCPSPRQSSRPLWPEGC